MKLQIYELSHPIIKIILNEIENNENDYKYIGLLLMYEILRNYISIKKIYIKKIKAIKEFNTINKNEKHFLLTNISNTYDMISEIKVIVPNIKIIHIDYSSTDKIEQSIKNLEISNNNTKIFIIEKITINEQISNLINYLIHNKQIDSKYINIGCVISHQKSLEQIANQYPKLKVYTTKIIYNNK
uniref:Uracil phosphoribosyltransferase n=1 Tax=Dipterosiphonia australica TaxID=2007208 RepID=A0A1Z1MMF7_9FLOR|nr:uracil phosphoribosyltransferase [Dipterosiphonia australica]ARW66931.1 uracil phosphoribosyltransferase [Dipterosiphonia australica]